MWVSLDQLGERQLQVWMVYRPNLVNFTGSGVIVINDNNLVLDQKRGENYCIERPYRLQVMLSRHMFTKEGEKLRATSGQKGNFQYAHGGMKHKFLSFWILYKTNNANRENIHRIYQGKQETKNPQTRKANEGFQTAKGSTEALLGK